MHFFAHVHSLFFYIFLLGPLWVPDEFRVYLYWYWILNLTAWLVLDRCPLFYLKSSSNQNSTTDPYKDKDDYLIHLHELGWLNKDDESLEYQEAVIRLVSGLAPLIVILSLGFHTIPTYIFAFIILLAFYKRCHTAISKNTTLQDHEEQNPNEDDDDSSYFSASSNI